MQYAKLGSELPSFRAKNETVTCATYAGLFSEVELSGDEILLSAFASGGVSVFSGTSDEVAGCDSGAVADSGTTVSVAASAVAFGCSAALGALGFGSGFGAGLRAASKVPFANSITWPCRVSQ